jgi:hypothetical protein
MTFVDRSTQFVRDRTYSSVECDRMYTILIDLIELQRNLDLEIANAVDNHEKPSSHDFRRYGPACPTRSPRAERQIPKYLEIRSVPRFGLRLL